MELESTPEREVVQMDGATLIIEGSPSPTACVNFVRLCLEMHDKYCCCGDDIPS